MSLELFESFEKIMFDSFLIKLEYLEIGSVGKSFIPLGN